MYSIKERVRYSEADEKGYLTLTGVVNYFQDCSIFESEDIGVGLQFLKTHKKGWILLSWQIIIERYPKAGEQIEVGTWPTDFNGLYATRNFVMTDEAGEKIAYANSIWVYMDMQAGRPVKPTEEDISVYKVEPELEMDYAPRKIKKPDNVESLEGFQVTKSQIDTNHHMNNSRYIQMALDVLPQGTDIRQMRAEYKKSAVEGDMVIPCLCVEEERTVVLLNDAEGKTYALLEFTGER